MLIAVTGTQGVGKSTLLNELAKIDYTVDNFKVSRTVQKEMGFETLAEAVDKWDTMANFQEEILRRKFVHDLELSNLKTKDIIFVERSFFDILAYTELWNNSLASETWHSEWMEQYRADCIDMQNNVYHGLIFIEQNDKIGWEIDHNRAAQDSQKQIETRLIELCQFTSVPILIIKDYSITTRVNEVCNFVNRL